MFKKDREDNLWLTRGDTLYLDVKNLKYKDEEGRTQDYQFENGDNVYFRLKINTETVIEKAFVVDVEENKATLELFPADTENLGNNMVYRYEVEVVTADDKHFTIKENKQFTIGTELEVHD